MNCVVCLSFKIFICCITLTHSVALMFLCCWSNEQGFYNLHTNFLSLSHSSSEEIRPSFTLSLSPDENPDEVLFPMVEHPNTHQEEPGSTCHAVSSCFEINVQTEDRASVELKEKRDTKRLNVLRHERGDSGGSDSRLKWQRPLSDPGGEATRGGGVDEGLLFQLSEYETIKSGEIHFPPSGFVMRQETRLDEEEEEEEEVQLMVGSESMTEKGAGQMSDREDEMHIGGKSKERRQRYAALPNKTGSPGEMKRFLLLGTNEISPSQRNLDRASTTRNGNKSSHCYSEGAKSVQREYNDPECSLNTPEVKHVEPPPGTENKETSVGYHTSCPKNTPVALESGNHKVSLCPAKTLPVSDQTLMETAEKCRTAEALVPCEPTKLTPDDTAADNLHRTTEAGPDVTEVGFEVETESGTEAGGDEKMETEQPDCSHVQLRNAQCEADYREAVELPRRDAEPGEREVDRGEPVVPPEDSQGESRSQVMVDRLYCDRSS